MTTIFQSESMTSGARASGTHVLIIAAGAYPALSGGDPKLKLDNTEGMRQLSSPPVSATALANWFLAGSEGSEMQGFYNPSAPLASIEMLVSPEQSYMRPDGTKVPVEAATKANISRRFDAWRLRAASHPDNISVFYFCGHGMTGLNDYILPADFGVSSPSNALSDAFDVATTARAMRQVAAGQQYFFIDACRRLSWSTLRPGARPAALLPLDPDKAFLCFCRLILSSTAEGDASHSNVGKVSWFTNALIAALSGAVGAPVPGETNWVVTGDRLASTVAGILASRYKKAEDDSSRQKRQVVNANNAGRQAFQYLTRQPKFVVQPEPEWTEDGVPKPWSRLPGMAAAMPFEQQVEMVEAVEERTYEQDGALPEESDFSLSARDYFDVVLPVMLRWKGEAATKLNKSVRFRLMDKPEQFWAINLRPPVANVKFQSEEHADLTIHITTASMQRILEGKFDAKKAIADGEIELYGDLGTLKSVGLLFTGGAG